MIQREDNRFKWHIRDAILRYLYEPYLVRREKQLKSLIERNCALLERDAKDLVGLTRARHRSFAFNGEYYSIDWRPQPPVRNRVHADLVAEAKQFYAEEYATLKVEKTKVSGYLDTVLSSSRRPGDFLLLLPTAIHDTVRNTITTDDWSAELSQEKIDAFLARHQVGYDLLRTRLAFNLIL